MYGDNNSVMLHNWITKVGSTIPRGFSKYYILALLKEQPMTGREVIDKAILQSEGRWKPSPGLVYPLLGRLLEEGLIKEIENGHYTITKKGIEIASGVGSGHPTIQKQLDNMLRLGNISRFMARDLLDRVSAIGSKLSSNLDRMTAEERDKYRQFLLSELSKLEKQDKKNT